MFQKSVAVLAVAVLLAASPAGAQNALSFPEMPVDSATLRVQNQAEEVYERGDYERAFLIYLNDLVPIGDKWAQYNVGYMYLTGKGVAEDIVAASAWYRLAAERGTKQFIRARDVVMDKLDDRQRDESDRQFIELRQRFGDLALLTRAIREDYETLRKGRTGTRVGADSQPVTIVDMDAAGATRDATVDYARIERQMKKRMEYLARHTEVGIIDLDARDVASTDIDAIERQVALHLSRLP